MIEEQLELFSMNSKPRIKHMALKDFRKIGFLQEANRLFFHPLGLALEVVVDEEEEAMWLGGIWDYRDDPEGMCFGDHINFLKASNVAKERARHASARVQLFGDVIQPIGWDV